MISGAEVARKLDLSPSAVSKLAARGGGGSITKRIADNLFDFK
jgi:predicted transcriptional regulator